ncbi:expressed protein [Phakopsora pachyrhizi]|uniref:Expressed protein n=1 Tax=Phakopsora pachyrhizi TaxID=170000 RepID=A0AAV0AQK6_PHAPC|nr:expressed protein [Phakopsora pachyrhizi]
MKFSFLPTNHASQGRRVQTSFHVTSFSNAMIKCLLSLLFIITFNESLTLGSFSKFFKGKPEEAINEVTDTVLQAKDQKVLKKSKSRITAVLPNSENLGEYITSKPKLDTVPTVTGKKERSSSSANFSQSIKKYFGSIANYFSDKIQLWRDKLKFWNHLDISSCIVHFREAPVVAVVTKNGKETATKSKILKDAFIKALRENPQNLKKFSAWINGFGIMMKQNKEEIRDILSEDVAQHGLLDMMTILEKNFGNLKDAKPESDFREELLHRLREKITSTHDNENWEEIKKTWSADELNLFHQKIQSTPTLMIFIDSMETDSSDSENMQWLSKIPLKNSEHSAEIKTAALALLIYIKKFKTIEKKISESNSSKILTINQFSDSAIAAARKELARLFRIEKQTELLHPHVEMVRLALNSEGVGNIKVIENFKKIGDYFFQKDKSKTQ